MQDICTEHKNILCGDPKGSILGPKLFIIYINEIFNILETLKLTLFAIDTNISFIMDTLLKKCA